MGTPDSIIRTTRARCHIGASLDWWGFACEFAIPVPPARSCFFTVATQCGQFAAIAWKSATFPREFARAMDSRGNLARIAIRPRPSRLYVAPSISCRVSRIPWEAPPQRQRNGIYHPIAQFTGRAGERINRPLEGGALNRVDPHCVLSWARNSRRPSARLSSDALTLAR